MKRWHSLALGLLVWPVGANCATSSAAKKDKVDIKPQEHVIKVADGRDIVIKAGDDTEVLRINAKGVVSYKGKPIEAPNEIILAFYESVMSNEYAHANCLIRMNQFRKAMVDASTVRTKPKKKEEAKK